MTLDQTALDFTPEIKKNLIKKMKIKFFSCAVNLNMRKEENHIHFFIV